MMMDDSAEALQPDLIKSDSVLNDQELLLTLEGGALNDDSKLKKVTPTKKNDSAKPKQKRRSPRTPWKKPKDMPRRPLSAYNLFFQRERERLLQCPGKKSVSADRESPIPQQVSSSDSSCDDQDKTNKERKDHPHLKKSGIGFANLAKTIASKWKQLNPTARSEFEALSATEKERYNKEMVVWRNKKKVEGEISERAQTIDAVLRSRALTHPAFMRRLSDPFPLMSHHQGYHHQQQKRFSGFLFTTPRLLRTYEEKSLEPIAITNFDPNQNTSQELGLHSFQDEASEMLRAFSDTFPHDHCEDIVADVSMSSEPKKPHHVSVAQSSLRALASSLDKDTVDFLTQLKFEY